MGFLAVGINHKTASVDVRERVAFAPDQLADALQQLRDETAAREVAILSTCNRTEIYCTQDQARPEQLIEWVARYHGLNPEDVARCSYVHREAGAVSHMMRVAAGLDSMVLGEPQILGQMKDAWQYARTAGTLGRSEEHTSELQSRPHLVCRLLLEKKTAHGQLRAGRAGRRLRLGPRRAMRFGLSRPDPAHSRTVAPQHPPLAVRQLRLSCDTNAAL